MPGLILFATIILIAYAVKISRKELKENEYTTVRWISAIRILLAIWIGFVIYLNHVGDFFGMSREVFYSKHTYLYDGTMPIFIGVALMSILTMKRFRTKSE